jgi:hypothetical protein
VSKRHACAWAKILPGDKSDVFDKKKCLPERHFLNGKSFALLHFCF